MPSLSPKVLIVTGFFIILAGLLWMYWGKYFHWIGSLPGDIRMEREGFRFYFPITTMVAVSVLLSFIGRVLRWYEML
jgi:hypothetical protein